MPLQSRKPEIQAALEQLRGESAIGAAIDADDGAALHRALLALERRAEGSQREWVRAVLSDRRLFGTPITRGPTMATLNGIGTSLYGKVDPDAESGTHIATLYFTFVFIPLWPIAAYLVAPGEKSGSYYFLARLPLAQGGRRARLIVGAAFALAAVAIAWTTFDHARHADVWVVNGLGRPVDVELGAERIRVSPQGREHRRLEAGPVHILSRVEDTVIEELDETVPGGVDVVVYNVGGLGPLAFVGAVYFADDAPPSMKNAEPPVEHLAGQRWIVRDDVPYVFEDAPSTLSMSKGATKMMRWQLFQADGGYENAASILLSADRPVQAFEVAARGALYEGADCTEAADSLAHLVRLGEHAQALELATLLVAHDPSCLEAHRQLQAVARLRGGIESLQARYSPAAPGLTPDAAARADYLAARIRDQLRTSGDVRTLQTQHPDFAILKEGYLAALREEGAYAALLEALGAAPRQDEPADAPQDRARALWGLGKRSEALSGLTAWAKTASAAGTLDLGAITLHAEMAQATRGADPLLFRGNLAGVRRALFDAFMGRTPDADDLAEGALPWPTVMAVELAARTDPKAAVRTLALPKATATFLRRTTMALLALEALRTGDAAGRARGWLDGVTLDARVSEALVAVVERGERGPAWPWAPPTLRAAALLVRSRVAAVSETERTTLIAEAKALENVPEMVHAAADGWPRPQ